MSDISPTTPTPNETCGALVFWDNGWWPVSHPCSKKPHEGGTHIAEFRSFGGTPMWAILPPGEKLARVYVYSLARAVCREPKRKSKRDTHDHADVATFAAEERHNLEDDTGQDPLPA